MPDRGEVEAQVEERGGTFPYIRVWKITALPIAGSPLVRVSRFRFHLWLVLWSCADGKQKLLYSTWIAPCMFIGCCRHWALPAWAQEGQAQVGRPGSSAAHPRPSPSSPAATVKKALVPRCILYSLSEKIHSNVLGNIFSCSKQHMLPSHTAV